MNSRYFACALAAALAACGGPAQGSLPQTAMPPVRGMPSALPASPDRIVYTPANVQIENAQYPVDLNNDKTTDFVISEANLKDTCQRHTDYFGTLTLTGQGSNGVEVSGHYAAQLASGSPIGPSQRFSTRSRTMEMAHELWALNCTKGPIKSVSGNWPPGSSGYLGLAFMILGKTHYGWAAITVSAPHSGWLSATLTGYAYQTTAGKSIKAGQM